MRIPVPSWLLTRLIRYGASRPYFHLKRPDGRAYMDRFWLMPRFFLRGSPPEAEYPAHLRPVSWLPASVRLHHILSSDNDRHLHDHPFDYVTWILSGGYWEFLPRAVDPTFHHDEHGREHEHCSLAFRAPGSILRRRATDRHRIKITNDAGAWTVFIQFRKRQPWGFYTSHGKVWWWNYEAEPVLRPRLATIRTRQEG